MSEHQDLSKCVLFNTKSIVNWMNANGINNIVSKYAGGGDSGGVEETFADDNPFSSNDLILSIDTTQMGYLDKNFSVKYDQKIEHSLSPILSIIERVTYAAISLSGNSGWENNDGGEGSLTITSDGKVTLNHSNFYQEEEEQEPIQKVLEKDEFKDLLLWVKKSSKENRTIIVEIYDGELNCDPSDIEHIMPDHLSKQFLIVLEKFKDDISDEEYGNGSLIFNKNGTVKLNYSININQSEDQEYTFEIEKQKKVSGYKI